MINKIPKDFLIRMQNLLDKDYEKLIDYFNNQEIFTAIRPNLIKISEEEFRFLFKERVDNKVDWEYAFYLKDKKFFSKSPLYHTGIYYIQEASSMLPVSVLDPKPGEKILDACASPGSKTTQIASRINNKGLIVANEIKSSRVGRLLENINRAGVKNSIVINSDIERLDFFDNYFDKALIDAPCSGEGMFKKDLDSLKIWTPNLVRMLAGIQRKILSSVSNLVKTGGTIVYSTCTMSIEENEENIDWFIKNFPFELQDIKYGKPGFISYKDKHFDENITKTKRIFPFFEKGEPFFVAKLIKKDRGRTEKKYISKSKMSLKSDIKLDKIVNELKNIGIQIEKSIKIKNINNNIYDISNIDVTAIEMIGERVKISQMGTKIGVLKNNRIEPDYSLAMSISKEEIDKYPNIELDEEKVIKYLRGQEFEIKIPKGYYIATYKKYPLGWLKYSDKLKNLFPSYIRGKI